jgi:hypothetical protein
MIFNPQNIQDLDLSKYKRFFAIGCSFTSYYWDTWADILAKEMSDCEYINLGRIGGGNTYILSTLSQLIALQDLNNDDLVVCMFSEAHRYDIYSTKHFEGWTSSGHSWPDEWNARIGTHPLYVEDILRKLFLDLHSAVSMLSSISSDSMVFTQGSSAYEDYDDLTCYEKYSTAYKSTLEHVFGTPSYITYCNMDRDQKYLFEYADHDIRSDYHPHILATLQFIEDVGITLSDATIKSATETHQQMLDGMPWWYDQDYFPINKKNTAANISLIDGPHLMPQG